MKRITRRNIMAATAAGAIDARGTETVVAFDADKLANVSTSVLTVAQLTASRFAKSITDITILGFHRTGTGAFSVRRADSEPPHRWKFRSSDRYLPNGSTDATNGGWWEGYPQDGVTLRPEYFGAVADATYTGGGTVVTGTDNYTAFTNMLTYIEWQYVNGNQVQTSQGSGFAINLGRGGYYISKTLHFRVMVNIYGSGGAGDYMGANMFLVFPPNTTGLYFHNYASVGGSGGIVGCVGAAGSKISRLAIVAQRADWGAAGGWDGVAGHYGINARGKVIIDDIQIQNFYGDGLYITGDCSDVRFVAASGNCGHGIHIYGGDGNAGVYYGCILTGNGQCGVYEESFLGNLHLGHEADGNGHNDCTRFSNCTAIVQEAGKTYWIIQDSSSTPSQVAAAQTSRPSKNLAVWALASTNPGANPCPVWGQVLGSNGNVYTVIPGQEAKMWAKDPVSSPAVWSNSGAPIGDTLYIHWALNWSPYTKGGDYYAYSDNAANQFINCYSEGVNMPWAIPPNFLSLTSRMQGGFAAGWVSGSGANPGTAGASVYKAAAFDTVTRIVNARLGGDTHGNNTIWSHSFGDASYNWQWNYDNSGTSIVLIINGSLTPFVIYGPGTTIHSWLGTDPLPGLMQHSYGMFLNWSAPTLVTTSGSGAPASGSWGPGDLVFNSDAINAAGTSLADNMMPLAFRCTVKSSGGAGAGFRTIFGIDNSGRTVSQLPASTYVPYDGAPAYVTDALKPLIGAPVVGGGSVTCLVNKVGSNWLVVSAPPLVTTVAGLPAASAGNKGARAMVTDANSTTFLSTVAGRGSNIVPVISDGTKWLIG